MSSARLYLTLGASRIFRLRLDRWKGLVTACAQQLCKGAPWVIRSSDLDRFEVKQAAEARRLRKIQASKEVWGKLFGSISTRERFLDMRFELASHEWERLKANDSLECRNCHSAESMDISKQSQRAANAHQRSLFTGDKTCIDCHKGIAHHLPKGAYDFGLAHEVSQSGELNALRAFVDERRK